MMRDDGGPAYFWHGDVLVAPTPDGGIRAVAHFDEFPQLRRMRALRERQEQARAEKDRAEYGY